MISKNKSLYQLKQALNTRMFLLPFYPKIKKQLQTNVTA